MSPDELIAHVKKHEIASRGIMMRLQAAMSEVGAAAFIGDGLAEQRARDMCHVLQDQMLDGIVEMQRLARTMINGA
jgi:hypothetical protein